jgi:hypothetical protein
LSHFVGIQGHTGRLNSKKVMSLHEMQSEMQLFSLQPGSLSE